MSEQPAVIGIVMGSNSDWPTMQAALVAAVSFVASTPGSNEG